MGAEYKWREITYRGRRAAEITACPGELPLLKVPETVVLCDADLPRDAVAARETEQPRETEPSRHTEPPRSAETLTVVSLAKAALRGSETVQTVCLPETLVSLGDFAFYGCSALRELSFYDTLKEVGDGAVRACPSLKLLCLRVGAGEENSGAGGSGGSAGGPANGPAGNTAGGADRESQAQPFRGLKSFLADSDFSVTVRIEWASQSAELYFPSFVNDFDEDTMARAIHPRIEGCGCAYREMVTRTQVNFRGYDQLFPRAAADGPAIASRVAFSRLRCPAELSREAELQYENYLRDQSAALMPHLIRDGRKQDLSLLITRGLLTEEALERGISLSSEGRNTEICGMLMAYHGKHLREARVEAGAGSRFGGGFVL